MAELSFASRSRPRLVALAALALLLAAGLGLSPAMAGDETHLHVQFQVVGGRFAVDRMSEYTSLSPFDPAEYKLHKDQVQSQLIDILDRALAKTDKILVLDGEQCSPASPGNQALCDLSDRWAGASDRFAVWADDKRPGTVSARYLIDVFEKRLLGLDMDASKLRPLIDPTALVDGEQSYDDLEMGQMDFVVRPPIQDRAGHPAIKLRANAGAFVGRISQSAMTRSLAPLSRQMWDFDRIQRELGDLLGLVRLQSVFVGGESRDPPLNAVTIMPDVDGSLIIDGPAPISGIQIAFKPGGDEAAQRVVVMKILYLLLPSEVYGQVRSHPEWIAPLPDQRLNGQAVDYRIVRFPVDPTLPLPTLYTNQLQDTQGALAQVGYQALPLGDESPPSGSSGKWNLLLVTPSDSGETTAPSQDGAPPPPAPAAGAGQTASSQPKGDKPSAKHAPSHWLSVGGGRQAGQPGEAYVEYRQTGLVGDDAITIHAGTRGKPIVSGSYDKDFVGFGLLGSRLTVSVQGASDYKTDVPVGADRANERRSGGDATATFEFFRDWGRQAFALNGGFGYEDVALELPAGSAAQAVEHISHVAVGASYAWLGGETLNVPNITFEPNLTAAWGDGNTPLYWKASARGVAHDQFENFLEYDLRAGFDWASARTSQTELPRFGGEESLRGLRPDAGAGTLVWSAQNELWAPLRFTDRFGPAVDGFIRNDLKIAAFIDMGGAAHNQQGLPAFNAGAGLGLRYKLQGRAALRLDWAHLVTPRPRGMADQAIYFSIVLLPFPG